MLFTLKSAKTLGRRAGPALAIAFALLHLSPISASAAEVAPVNTATLLAARAYPGIQLIQTDYTATLSVPRPIVNESAVKAASVRIGTLAVLGAIERNNAAYLQALVDEMSKNIFGFLSASSTRASEEVTLTGVGTGWVVTPDGYMVTAAHVVKADPDELKTQFAAQALDKLAAQTLEGLTSGNTGGTKFTTAQLAQLTKAITTWFERYLTVGTVKTSVSAQIGVAVAGYKKSQRGRPVEIVSVGEPYPGKDVAILKLDGETQLPTLPVGKNENVDQGSTLYVAGYPAASTFYSGLSKDSEVQPTVTQGPLTAIKDSAAGSPIFQTQAPASPGNSGGPVLDSNGQVVGILVASAVDTKGVALEGQGFVIPISVVSEKLREKNITPRTGDTTTIYNSAVSDFYKHWYTPALEKFSEVANLYPGHPYVGEFKSKAQAGINAGQDQTPRPLWFWILIAGAVIAVLALLVGLGFAIFIARRRKQKAAIQQPGPFIDVIQPTPAASAPAQWTPSAPAAPSPPAAPSQWAAPPAAAPPAAPSPGAPPPPPPPA